MNVDNKIWDWATEFWIINFIECDRFVDVPDYEKKWFGNQ